VDGQQPTNKHYGTAARHTRLQEITPYLVGEHSFDGVSEVLQPLKPDHRVRLAGPVHGTPTRIQVEFCA
jgi:hypothetical protein